MSIPVVPLAFLLFMPALFVIAWAIDRARGLESESDLVVAIGNVNRQLSPDDAPLWAEVLDVLLAVGLTIRSGCHLAAAAAAGVDLELADLDISAGNAVVAVRAGDWRPDAGGRVIAVCAAVGVWLLVEPLTTSWPGPAWATLAGRAYVLANIGVLASDPVLYLAHRTRLNTIHKHGTN